VARVVGDSRGALPGLPRELTTPPRVGFRAVCSCFTGWIIHENRAVGRGRRVPFRAEVCVFAGRSAAPRTREAARGARLVRELSARPRESVHTELWEGHPAPSLALPPPSYAARITPTACAALSVKPAPVDPRFPLWRPVRETPCAGYPGVRDLRVRRLTPKPRLLGGVRSNPMGL
jgi:hypothetical protein